MYVVISYDISDDRRRARVMKLLKLFGDRVQYSVFEGDMEQEEVDRMLGKLSKLIKEEEDRVRIYPLCAGCMGRVRILGRGELMSDPELVVI